MNRIKKTKEAYRFLWSKIKTNTPIDSWHFNDLQNIIPEPIVRGKIGIDIGSGCGYDSYIMAMNNPRVKIVSLDISDGIYKAREFATGLKNVLFTKGSVLEMPIKDSIFDFAYSFGVLHHTPDPEKGLREIARVLKRNASVYLYLYEDHSENFIKYLAIKLVSILRKITVRMNPRILYIFSYMASPLLVIIFSYPARILKKFKVTKCFANKIPFNFGTHPFSLSGDIYDRFIAPVEHRFSRKDVFGLLTRNGFSHIKVEKLKNKAGWVAWGCKINA